MIGVFASCLALGCALCSLVLALAALAARSLFTTAVQFGAAGAMAAVALLVLGKMSAALALALAAVAWAPLLMFGGMMLSSRTTGRTGKRPPVMLLIAGLALSVALLWAVKDASGAARETYDATPMSLWLAPLIFAVALGCVSLVGQGERGALERTEHDL